MADQSLQVAVLTWRRVVAMTLKLGYIAAASLIMAA